MTLAAEYWLDQTSRMEKSGSASIPMRKWAGV